LILSLANGCIGGYEMPRTAGGAAALKQYSISQFSITRFLNLTIPPEVLAILNNVVIGTLRLALGSKCNMAVSESGSR
jgi:hypothetical protein